MMRLGWLAPERRPSPSPSREGRGVAGEPSCMGTGVEKKPSPLAGEGWVGAAS